MEIRIYIFITVLTILVLATLYLWLIAGVTKQYIKIWYGQCKTALDKYKRRKRLLNKVDENLVTGKYGLFGMEILFTIFKHFYEENFSDIENAWEFHTEFFPNGKKDLSDIYKWLTKTRIENYEEVDYLNFKKDHFIYWGSSYQGFTYKISEKGELFITPVEYIESENPELAFELKKMKLRNDLSALDTQKVMWLIERRHSLMI